MKLTEEQREILMNALVEDWIESFVNNFKHFDNFVREMLFEGRIGVIDYSDKELIEACLEADLENALEEAGVMEEDDDPGDS